MKKLFFALAIAFSFGVVNAQNSAEITKKGTITQISSDLSTGKLVGNETGVESEFINPSGVIVSVGDNVIYVEIKGRSIPENSIEFIKGRSIPENSIEMITGGYGGRVINIIKGM